MVTKGYRKGVYERVTLGIRGRHGRWGWIRRYKDDDGSSTNGLWGGVAGRVYSSDARLDRCLAASFCAGGWTRGIAIMTWIKTVPIAEANEKLREAIEGQRGLYPKEYREPVHPDESGGSSIVGSHTLIQIGRAHV